MFHRLDNDDDFHANWLCQACGEAAKAAGRPVCRHKKWHTRLRKLTEGSETSHADKVRYVVHRYMYCLRATGVAVVACWHVTLTHCRSNVALRLTKDLLPGVN